MMDIHFDAPGLPSWTASDGERLDAVAERFPGCRLVRRDRFVMTAGLVEKVRTGRKTTTIRYDADAVEYPSRGTLPVFAVGPGRRHDEAEPAGEVVLASVRYVRLRDLSDGDAEADGFRSRCELLDALRGFYPGLAQDSIVCIYGFRPVGGTVLPPAQPTCRTEPAERCVQMS